MLERYSHALRPRRRPARAEAEGAAGRDQRAAGDASAPVRPERAGRREGLDARRSTARRPRRPARTRCARRGRRPPPSAALAGKQSITLSRSLDRAVPAVLGAPRPAREGLQRLDRARRERRRHRQPRDHRARCWRCAPSARGCSATTASPHYKLDDTMAKTPEAVRDLLDGGLGAGARAGAARRPTTAGADRRRTAATARIARLGLALLRREGAQGRGTTSTKPS